jgi:hypothetical protein
MSKMKRMHIFLLAKSIGKTKSTHRKGKRGGEREGD